MKMKVGEMMTAFRVAERLSGQKMPAKAAYWVSRLVSKLHPEFVVVEKKRFELVKKHGQPTPEGGHKVEGEESLKAFQAEFGAILDEEIDLDVPTVKLELFGTTELLPADLIALDKLVVQEAAP